MPSAVSTVILGTKLQRGSTSKMRVSAAVAFSAMLAMAGCDGAGEHQDADTVRADGAQQPATGPEAASQVTRIPDAPPAGTTGPTPPDGNPSPTTPMDPSQPGGPPATGGGVQPGTGTESGGVGNGATPAPGGTQP